jgi:hypothetical protein
MGRNRDTSDATVARQRAFGNCSGAFRDRGDREQHQSMAPKTTVEC